MCDRQLPLSTRKSFQPCPGAAKRYKTLACVVPLGTEFGEHAAIDNMSQSKPGLQDICNNVYEVKRTSNISINLSIGDVQAAAYRAFKEHGGKREVMRFMADFEANCGRLYEALKDGTWKRLICYTKMEKVGVNGKRRLIDRPSLEARVYQHLLLNMLEPVYFSKDPLVGLNCKKGCGQTAKEYRNSLVKRMKRLFYDRRDLHYALVIDQRECYAHITPGTFRKELKRLVDDPWLVDFATDVCMVDGKLPIGTPTSPMAHHIVMLGFDQWAVSLSPLVVRYADDCLLAFQTKEEAQAAKWRVKQFWWYTLGIRAKRHRTLVVPLDSPLDFCGYVHHRSLRSLRTAKSKGHADKGYTTIRRNTADSARHCRRDESWASYFGQMAHADCYHLMRKIEEKMKLRQLTEKIRIDRKMDARHIDLKDLIGVTFTIYDYEVRYNGQKEPNWMKCLIGVEETKDGQPTGKTLAYEFHGNYQGLIQFILACEAEYGKQALLPMEEMEVENQCGYIFKGSTNQMTYIE